MDESAPSSKPIARRSIGDIASFVAVALSLLALVTSAYQAQLMRDQTQIMQTQSRASVWPLIAIGENDTHTASDSLFTWRVDNNGVGPAKIESVVVNLDGKPYRTWKEISAVLVPDRPYHAAQSPISGVVLPPSLNRETTVEMVKLTDSVLAKAFFDAQPRFKIEICYCSVYDDCWIAHNDDHGKKAVVRSCENVATTQFEE